MITLQPLWQLQISRVTRLALGGYFRDARIPLFPSRSGSAAAMVGQTIGELAPVEVTGRASERPHEVLTGPTPPL